MAKRDFYEVLGLNKGASQDEIKKAYRKKAMEHHPDKGGDEAIFKEIAEAYEVLSDQEKKSNYDQYGHDGMKQNFGGGGYDPFSDFIRRSGFNPFGDNFHHTHQSVRRGNDLTLTLNLTLEEIFNGTNKKFKYKRNVTCGDCSGKGGTGTKVCPACGGTGGQVEVINTPFGQIRNSTICGVCEGKKTIVDKVCSSCNGHGVRTIEDLVEVNIPHGVQDGMRMNLREKGNAVKNGTPGDLYVNIVELPHDNFTRSGYDLILKTKLTYPQLVLGDKIEVSTIENTKIRIQINPLTNVGETLRIQNKGLKHLNSSSRGDLLLNINLLMPDKITDEEKNLIESLKKLNDKVVTSETN